MPIPINQRQQRNIPELKDYHTRSELWNDKIYFLEKNEWASDDSFYWPMPSRFTEILNSFKNEYYNQEQATKEIELVREEVWTIWRQIRDWIVQSLESVEDNHPDKPDLEALELVFRKGSLNQQIKLLGEFVVKHTDLVDLNRHHQEIKDKWEKGKRNYNFCFIEEHTDDYLKFTFQVPDRKFFKLDDYFFIRNEAGTLVYYEVMGHDVINHQNAIVYAQRSIFWNNWQENYNKGWAGVINSSPLLPTSNEICACPPFADSTHHYEFYFEWQPTYSLWQVVNPLGNPKGFDIKGQGLNGEEIILGRTFTTYDLKKVTSDPISWKLVDTIFFLLPEDFTSKDEYDRSSAYQENIKSTVNSKYTQNGIQYKPLGKIKRKSGGADETIEKFLKEGFKLSVGGFETSIDLTNPEYYHLHDHISVQFYFNDKGSVPYRLSDIDLKEIEINITANPAKTIYTLHSKRISFKFSEQTKLVMEASKIAKAGLALSKAVGADVAKGLGKVVSWIPVPGAQTVGKIFKWFGSKKDEVEKISDAATSVMSDWNKTLESKTNDARTGGNERQGERKATMGSLNIPSKSTDKNTRSSAYSGKSIYSSSNEGHRQAQNKSVGQGDTVRSARSRSTTVSYSYNPSKTTTDLFGSIPAVLASTHLENSYSLLEFLVHKKSPALKIRLSLNKTLLEHYINNKSLLKKDGHQLTSTTKLVQIINKPGFYNLTTHMMEKDKKGFFTNAFAQGRHLYQNTPGEIFNTELGKLKVPISNTVISQLLGMQTTMEEDFNEVGATDNEADLNFKLVWLNYSSYLKKETESDEIGRSNMRKLVESRPKTGAPTNQYVCPKHKKLGTLCFKEHPPFAKDKRNPDGDFMEFYTEDQKYFKEGWIEINTEYWKTTREKTPDDWSNRSNSIFYTKEDAEKYVKENTGGHKNHKITEDTEKTWTYTNETVEIQQGQSLPPLKSDEDWSNQGGAWKNVVSYNYTYDVEVFDAKGVPTGEIIKKTGTGKGGGNYFIRYQKKKKTGTRKVWSVEYNYNSSYSYKKNPVKITKEEYEKLLANKPNNVVKLEKKAPDGQELIKVFNPPSWKFGQHNWSSKDQGVTILLDKNQKYKAQIRTFQGSQTATLEHPEEKDTDHGIPWECWLEQRQKSFVLVFNRVKVIGFDVGNIDDIGGGTEYVDARDNFEEIKIEDLGESGSEGVTKVVEENIKTAEDYITLEDLKRTDQTNPLSDQIAEAEARAQSERKKQSQKHSTKEKGGYQEDTGDNKREKDRNK